MDDKQRSRIQLDCLYDMFRDKVEENVIYIVYSENDGKIDITIDQLMSIAACSLTGYDFESLSKSRTKSLTGLADKALTNATNTSRSASSSPLGRLTRGNSVGDTGSVSGSTETDAQKKSNTSNEEDDKQLDIDRQIEIVQNSIKDLLTEKNACHDKASHYLSKKMYPVTGYYSELSGNYRRMIETKTRKLVDLLLSKSANANSIDLHGLNPIQAKLVVNELLNMRQEQLSIDKQGKVDIDIITGWGKHTVHTGQHRIRPTIVSLLREKGFEYYLINKGALRVTIRR